MGWKVSSIIINSQIDTDYESFLSMLGFNGLEKIPDQPYEIAMNPKNNQVFIGYYKNNLILSASNLPFLFFNEEFSNLEKKLINYFPDSEICAVSLQSTINHYGFALIKNHKKERVKSGDADNGLIIDYGEPLKEELELLAKSKVNEKGERVYYLDHDPTEPYYEDQVGENFVFEIFKRYTGEKLDSDNELTEAPFSGFKFSAFHNNFNNPLSGNWNGLYILGDGYKKLKGESTTFLLEMGIIDNNVSGTCIDENKQSDDPAIIEGFIKDNSISFLKKYSSNYSINSDGKVQKNLDKSPYNIIYIGLYDPLFDNFRGIWRIENKDLWGEWYMKRKYDE